jgi:hypothetical protein
MVSRRIKGEETMLGWKLIHKRELLLYVGQINDLRQQIAKLERVVDHERKRAEAAINGLLMKKQNIAINPDEMTLEQENRIKEQVYDIFSDTMTREQEKKLMEKIQS